MQGTSSSYTVHDSELPVKIALVWTDTPALESSPDASTGYTTSPLVNDLDLSVEYGSPCSGRFIGNKLSGTDEIRGEESTPFACGAGTFDRTNNVEIVRFYQSALGVSQFTVRIGYFSGSGAQPFSLVIYNAYETGGTPPPAVPTNVVAAPTLNPANVHLSWTAASGASVYEIQRRNGTGYYARLAGEISATSFDDASVTSPNAYVYRVRGVNDSGASSYSAPAVATLFQFSEVIIDAATAIKASHIDELRSSINIFRQAVGLSSYAFTDSALAGHTILATHMNELRAALDEARGAAGMPAMTYTDNSILPSVTPVKGIHVREIRSGVNGVNAQ